MRRSLVVVVTLFVSGFGCAAAGPAVANAALNTAVGVGAAAASRSVGGCYSACPPGTACNQETGYCDALPCRGLCQGNEYCDNSGPLERCVKGSTDAKLKVDEKLTPQ